MPRRRSYMDARNQTTRGFNMSRKFSELERAEQLLLLGHVLNAVGVLMLSIGSILRSAGSLPEAPITTSGRRQGEAQITAKNYF
jgi:hypothetical protein